MAAATSVQERITRKFSRKWRAPATCSHPHTSHKPRRRAATRAQRRASWKQGVSQEESCKGRVSRSRLYCTPLSAVTSLSGGTRTRASARARRICSVDERCALRRNLELALGARQAWHHRRHRIVAPTSRTCRRGERDPPGAPARQRPTHGATGAPVPLHALSSLRRGERRVGARAVGSGCGGRDERTR